MVSMSQVELLKPRLSARVDQFVDAFETARGEDPSIRLTEFLPERSDPDFYLTATELLRVDLELHWSQGKPKRLAEYRREFGELLRDPTRLNALAFEEYRLRLEAGEPVAPLEYRRQFQIDTDHWPSPPRRTKTDVADDRWSQTLAEVTQSSIRLLDAIADFPAVGSEFAGFQIERLLGSGCFGRVFLARQSGLASRPIVLKVTAGESGEAYHLARLQHTNIVPIYSVHDVGSLRAICMPFLGTRTLADIIQRRHTASSKLDENQCLPLEGHVEEPTSVQTTCANSTSTQPSANTTSDLETVGESLTTGFLPWVAELATSIARGLEYAHDRGIVHRDIKPANILLTDEGQPLLLDFNVSQDNTRSDSIRSVAGTLPYMAPEQLRNLHRGTPSDPRSDIYSFGVVLYELLTGRHPYQNEVQPGDTIIQHWLQAESREVKNPRLENPAIPTDLAAIVVRCLEPNLDHRYGSATELRQDLECHLEDRPLLHTVDPSPIHRIIKWKRRHPRAWIVASVVPLIITLVLLSARLEDRQRQLQLLQAQTLAQQVAESLPAVRVDLSVVAASTSQGDANSLERGIETGEALLEQLALDDTTTPAWLDRLSPDQRLGTLKRLVETSYLLAIGTESIALHRPDDATQWRQSADAHRRRASRLASELGEPISRLLYWQEQSSEQYDATSQSSMAAASNHDHEAGFLALHTMLRERRYDEAIEMLQVLRRTARFDFSAWLLLGDTHLARGDLGEADACYEAAVSLWPELDRCYAHRGICRLLQSRHNEAIDDFSEALARYPDHLGALLNRGLCYLALERYDLAEADFTGAIQRGCTQTRVWLLRAQARRALGREEEAEADQAMALKLTPTDEQSAVAVGNSYLKAEPGKALQYYQLAHKLAPHRRSPRRNMAHVIGEKNGQNEAAIEILDSLVDEFQNAQDVVARGVLLARLGKRDQASADAKRALELDASAKVHFQVGCIYALLAAEDNELAGHAIQQIAIAIQEDGRWAQVAARDTDLVSLRPHPKFRSLLSAAFLLEKTSWPHGHETSRDIMPRQRGRR